MFMAISVYDVNTHLKNDATILSIAGKTMSFFPVVATDGESAPYVVYYYNPMVSNVETYWERYDYIKYSIFDTDVDRLFRLADRFINLLSIGDQVAQSGGIQSSTVRILSSKQTGSSLNAPLEINGLYRMNLDFRICLVVK
jgi:hypothetical protein